MANEAIRDFPFSTAGDSARQKLRRSTPITKQAKRGFDVITETPPSVIALLRRQEIIAQGPTTTPMSKIENPNYCGGLLVRGGPCAVAGGPVLSRLSGARGSVASNRVPRF